jgi:chromosome segregation ATPase
MIGRDTTVLKQITEPFPRITYEDAVKILKGELEVDGKNAIKTLEADLVEVEARIAAIQAEIAEREAKMAVPGMKKGEIGFHQSKIQQLKEELGAAQSALADYSELRDREGELRTRIDEMARENRMLKDSSQQANAAVTLQEQKMLAMSERISLMGEGVFHSVSPRKQTSDNVEPTELKLETAKSRENQVERDVAVKEARDLKVLVDGYQKERRQLMEQRSHLEEDIDAAASELNSLRADQSATANLVQTLEDQLKESAKVVAALEAAREKLRADLAEREAEVFEQSRAIDKLRSQANKDGAGEEGGDADQGRWHKMYLDMQRQGREETDRLKAELDRARSAAERDGQRMKQRLAVLEEEIGASEKARMEKEREISEGRRMLAGLEEEVQRVSFGSMTVVPNSRFLQPAQGSPTIGHDDARATTTCSRLGRYDASCRARQVATCGKGTGSAPR